MGYELSYQTYWNLSSFSFTSNITLKVQSLPFYYFERKDSVISFVPSLETDSILKVLRTLKQERQRALPFQSLAESYFFYKH